MFSVQIFDSEWQRFMFILVICIYLFQFRRFLSKLSILSTSERFVISCQLAFDIERNNINPDMQL